MPQQRLLLGLLIASGKIAVPVSADPTLPWSTLGECEAAGWIRPTEIGQGMHRLDITAAGGTGVQQGPPSAAQGYLAMARATPRSNSWRACGTRRRKRRRTTVG